MIASKYLRKRGLLVKQMRDLVLRQQACESNGKKYVLTKKEKRFLLEYEKLSDGQKRDLIHTMPCVAPPFIYLYALRDHQILMNTPYHLKVRVSSPNDIELTRGKTWLRTFISKDDVKRVAEIVEAEKAYDWIWEIKKSRVSDKWRFDITEGKTDETVESNEFPSYHSLERGLREYEPWFGNFLIWASKNRRKIFIPDFRRLFVRSQRETGELWVRYTNEALGVDWDV